MFRYLQKNRNARHVAMLSSGTAIAQAIPIAVSPILTRMYTPEEFGLAAVYLSGVAILSIVATGRYELAIILPKSDLNAAHIVALTLKICATFSLLLFVPIAFFGQTIAGALGNHALAPWFYLLPISVMATGTFNTFQFWCNRTSQYRRMSTNRVQNAAATASANVAFGFAHVDGGLVLGGVIGQALSAGWIGRLALRENQSIFSEINVQGQWEMARRYSSHPKHIGPSHLIGTVAIQVPTFLVSSIYSLSAAGAFSLAYRLVSLPTGLIASAIGDVYRQKISVAYNERGHFRDIYLKTVKATAFLAILPFAALFFAAPPLFAFVFGENWRIAGSYAQILVVASYFQFVFTPVDKGALVVGATRYIFGWHLTRLICLVLLFFLAKVGEISLPHVLWIFVAINCLLYIGDGLIEFILAKGHASVK